MSIRVVNKRNHVGLGEYIARPSVLGNPFRIGPDGNRAMVIEKYRQWLWARIKDHQGPEWDELQRLASIARDGELVLICWCAPLPCHGDIIKAAIEWLLSQPLEVG